MVKPEDACVPLPPRFAARFDPRSLVQQTSTLVAVDPNGIMLWVNPAWHSFALTNAGAATRARFGIGSSYFAGITGPLRDYYTHLFAEAYSSGCVLQRDYECSSSDVHRAMHLRALPVRGAGLLLEHSVLRESAMQRTAEAALGVRYVNDHGFIVQCSNCRRTRQVDANVWDWVPDWVASPHPAASHGLCEVCVAYYYGPNLA
ncbi:MAG TPA: hypothetical protein VJR89_07200 [Polyangiales bacterium]|nr:hypothetical protein [Polyangiales bacterium]